MDQKILKEWCDFCEGRFDADSSYFLTLFHGNVDETSLKAVLQYFPNTEELVFRVKSVKEAKSERQTWSLLEPERCLEIARVDLSERMKSSIALGDQEIVKIARSAAMKFDRDFSNLEREIGNYWNIGLIENVGDYLRYKMISNQPKYYAIFEAFYGITTLFPIQWYIGAPLTEVEYDFSNFIQLWKMRGDYVLTEDEVVVSQSII